MGGEKQNMLMQMGYNTGSPPRGRGKGVLDSSDLQELGITPAWAGKSRLRFRSLLLCRDHPRVGGEKLSCLVYGHRHKGSPPRGRGKVSFFTYVHVCKGITPAWAGKSPSFHYPYSVNEDHPRVGGEKSRVAPRSDPGTGSPPRGRGKETRGKGGAAPFRITPAWAGKSPFMLWF